MGKENNGNENDEPGDQESSRASQYLNKRKAILMSNNKVALPTHLQKRLTKASPFIPNLEEDRTLRKEEILKSVEFLLRTIA